MRELAIESLAVRGFRNLAALDVPLGPGLNVLSGDNGQGKTNVLEAIYLAATSRSFRTSRAATMIAHGAEGLAVRARVIEQGVRREQSVGVRAGPGGPRDVRVDGRRAARIADYAVMTPVVVFHPGSVALSSGSGAERRRLLDRLALYRSPAFLAEATAYTRSVRARQRVLEGKGEGARDLNHWEDLAVRHGTAIALARSAAVSELGPAAREAFERIGPSTARLEVAYLPNPPGGPEAFRAALRSDRARDRARRSASSGPHRDDLELSLEPGVPVRGVASQGQHRAIVLALELAEMALVAAARGVQPILLLDDFSSELDRERTQALLAAIGRLKGQIVLTTTRPELVETFGAAGSAGRRDLRVVAGRVVPP